MLKFVETCLFCESGESAHFVETCLFLWKRGKSASLILWSCSFFFGSGKSANLINLMECVTAAGRAGWVPTVPGFLMNTSTL